MTGQWSVSIASPRPGKREQWSRLIARLRIAGKVRVEKQRVMRDVTARPVLEAEAAAWLSRLQAGEVDTPAPGERTVLSIVDARVASLVADPDTSPNTVRSYNALRKSVAASSIAGVACSKLRVPHVLQAQAELARGPDGPRKGSTVRLMLSQLAAAWRWARDGELVATDWPKPPRRRAPKATTTSKRGYQDHEVAHVLAWVRDNDPEWLGAFQILADTGQRIGAVLGLRGKAIALGAEPTVTFREQWIRGTSTKPSGWRPLKTRDVVTIPVPLETAALLPVVGPDELLWPNERDRTRPSCPETIRAVLYRALEVIGVADRENLDTHSLRRAWVTTAKRKGIPDAVGMQITNHRERKTYDGYGRNAVGDDLRAAVMTVHEARTAAAVGAPTGAPTAAIAEPLTSEDLEQDQLLTSKLPVDVASLDSRALSLLDAVGAGRTKTHGKARRNARVGWGRDPVVARLASWADQDPGAMRALLSDEVLRAQLVAALDAVAPVSVDAATVVIPKTG